MKSIPLHVKILIGLVFVFIWGVFSVTTSPNPEITMQYIQPIGALFIALLKMVAMPLVLASLVVGVASMNDLRKLSRMGGRTLVIYISTTMIAIILGLILLNLIRPGHQIPEATRKNLMELYKQNIHPG